MNNGGAQGRSLNHELVMTIRNSELTFYDTNHQKMHAERSKTQFPKHVASVQEISDAVKYNQSICRQSYISFLQSELFYPKTPITLAALEWIKYLSPGGMSRITTTSSAMGCCRRSRPN